MELKKKAVAGTLESSDMLIMLEPGDGKIEIELESSVEKQFGKQIRELMMDVLKRYEIDNVKIKAVDKGAIDYVIKARLTTAIYRSAEVKEYTWEEN